MSKRATFTMPGKMGDALMQWPVAFWWHKEHAEPFDVWMDEKTCAPLVPLFQAQPGIGEVKLVPGIESWNCGGQPWHMNIEPTAHDERWFIHLGLRAFPQRQLTLQARENAIAKLKVDPDLFSQSPSLVLSGVGPVQNRLLLHGQGIYAHTRQTPAFWKFLARNAKDFEAEFSEIVFVGSPSDREVGLSTYPHWAAFDDGGDFLKLAKLIAASRFMVGCGSAPIVLPGLLKTPAIRVHDPIGEAAAHIWSNLGINQLNRTEMELRSEWTDYKERFLRYSLAEEVPT